MDISFWGSLFNPLYHVKKGRKEFSDRRSRVCKARRCCRAFWVLRMARTTGYRVGGR